jgi:long-chain acyl-CoA synthetase
VVDVSVVGLPHADGGEEVVAAVVAVEGVPLQPEDLQLHSREGLTPYKVPRRVVFVDELPTNPMGKVLRREVVARLRG